VGKIKWQHLLIAGFRLTIIVISFPSVSYGLWICIAICYYVVKNNHLDMKTFSTELLIMGI